VLACLIRAVLHTALGNGAADVSATVSAITNDPENGYKLSLGALTGAAMVIGAVVSAGVVLVAGGVPCRGALVRDVAALGLAVLVVWKELGTGLMTGETVTLFLAMYVAFVMLVLLADIYHRAVVLPRRQLLAVERERQRQLQGETWHSDSLRQQQQEESTAVPPESQFSHVLTAFFNYDNPPSSASANAFGNNTDGGMGIDSEVLAAEEHILLHGTHGILGGRRGHSPARLLTDDDGAVTENEMSYDMMQDQMDAVCVDPSVGMTATGWTEAWEEGKAEVRRHGEALWDDVAYNGDLDVLSKYLLVLEFPTTVLRQATVSIPCEGYYNRGILALTLAVSPLWMAFYLNRAFGIAVWQTGQIWFGVYWLLAAVAAVGVLRHAPGGSGDSVMPSLWVATPVALYGFVIAASWIDTIADQLVGVLAFVGIVLKVRTALVGEVSTFSAKGNTSQPYLLHTHNAHRMSCCSRFPDQLSGSPFWHGVTPCPI
jgi:sodium/potassium/calcium exchanger 6